MEDALNRGEGVVKDTTQDSSSTSDRGQQRLKTGSKPYAPQTKALTTNNRLLPGEQLCSNTQHSEQSHQQHSFVDICYSEMVCALIQKMKKNFSLTHNIPAASVPLIDMFFGLTQLILPVINTLS